MRKERIDQTGSTSTAAQPEAPLVRREQFHTEPGIQDAPKPQEEPKNMDVQRIARRRNFRIQDLRRLDTWRNRVKDVSEERPDVILGTDQTFSRSSDEVLRWWYEVQSKAGISFVQRQEKKDDQRTSVG